MNCTRNLVLGMGKLLFQYMSLNIAHNFALEFKLYHTCLSDTIIPKRE